MKDFEKDLFKEDMECRIKEIRKLMKDIMDSRVDNDLDKEFLEQYFKGIENKAYDMAAHMEKWQKLLKAK